jgi:hypothetical protein
MYHSIRQQTGIAKMLVSSHTKVHSLWSVVAVISAIVGNLFIFAPLFFAQYAFLVSLPILTVCALCFVVVSAWYLSVLPSSGIGWWYIFATTTMLCTSYVFAVAGYVFFAILLVRFVHDATAFVFYSIHDSNRNAYTRKNFVYRLLKPTHLPLLCVTPVVGIGVAYVLQKYGVSFEQSASAVILIAVAHYYLESFMWKRDALHRKQLRFVA